MAAPLNFPALQKLGLTGTRLNEQPADFLYTHCPLPKGPGNIRLLQLLPTPPAENSSRSSPLVAQLSSPFLIPSVASQYETLSYVWGSSSKPEEIILLCDPSDAPPTIPGSIAPSPDSWSDVVYFKCRITTSLAQALRDLRLPGRTRVLWVDALCINQADDAEKSVQVRQMREVYVSAKRTIAHLGSEMESLPTLAALRDCREATGSWAARPRAPDGRGCMVLRPALGIARASQSPGGMLAYLVVAGVDFLVLRWLLRKFAPEALRSVATMVCVGCDLLRLLWDAKDESVGLMASFRRAEVLFSIEDILFAVSEFFVHQWFRRAWIVQECVVSPNLTFQVGREEFAVDEVRAMISAKNSLHSVAAVNVPASTHLLGFMKMCEMRDARKARHPSPPLARLLQWSWSYGLGSAATDPRDKIFALLGLLDEDLSGYLIDYGLDKHHIFWKYGVRIASSPDGWSRVLLEDARRHDGTNMPSWVPDFPTTSEHSLLGFYMFYCCCDGMPETEYKVSDDERLLEVDAILMSEIDHIGQRRYLVDIGPLEELHRTILTSGLSIQAATEMWKSQLDLDSELDNLLRQPGIKIPEGLDHAGALELIVQVGIFYDQRIPGIVKAEQGFLRQDVKDLIERTVQMRRYFILHIKGLLSMTDEDGKTLEAELKLLFADTATKNPVERRELFKIFAEGSENFPLMSRLPLFRALSQVEWPPQCAEAGDSEPLGMVDELARFVQFLNSIAAASSIPTWDKRRVAKTRDGYICNVGDEVQLGDRLAIVSGCRMPLVLREKEKGKYLVLGQAYVFGLMYGEATTKLGLSPERIMLC